MNAARAAAIPGFRHMGATETEIHDTFSPAHPGDPRGLGCSKGLEMDAVECQRLEYLDIGERAFYLDKGFVLEDDRAFRHRIQVPGEPVPAEILKEITAEYAKAVEVRDILLSKPELRKLPDECLKPARDKEIPLLRKGPAKEGKDCRPVLPCSR